MNITSIKDSVREYVGEDLVSFVEYSIDLAPYLGELNQTRKIMRADKRIKEHQEQLIRIGKLFSSEKLSKEYIQEKIGPIVLSDLIEEHEDAKINYLLNGFENVFINENTNESLVINYFDTLRNLRYEDLRNFYYYAAISESLPLEKDSDSALTSLAQQIYFKLERLYLVKSAKTWGALQKGAELLSEEERKVELTMYGIQFIKFISNDFNEKRYNDKVSKYTVPEEEKLSNIFGGTF